MMWSKMTQTRRAFFVLLFPLLLLFGRRLQVGDCVRHPYSCSLFFPQCFCRIRRRTVFHKARCSRCERFTKQCFFVSREPKTTDVNRNYGFYPVSSSDGGRERRRRSVASTTRRLCHCVLCSELVDLDLCPSFVGGWIGGSPFPVSCKNLNLAYVKKKKNSAGP